MLSWKDIWQVIIKELRVGYRHREFIIGFVLLPALLYPIFALGLTEFTLWRAKTHVDKIVKIAIVPADHMLVPRIRQTSKKWSVKVVASKDPAHDLELGLLDGWVHLDDPLSVVNIKTRGSVDPFSAVLDENQIRGAVGSAATRELKERAKNSGMPRRLLTICTFTEESVGQKTKYLGSQAVHRSMNPFFGSTHFKSLLAVMSLLIACVAYLPAASMLVEEHEQKTIETTFLLATERRNLLLGKFIAACVLTALAMASLLGWGGISLGIILGSSMIAKGWSGFNQETWSLVERFMQGVLMAIPVFWLSCAFITAIYFLCLVKIRSMKTAYLGVTVPILILSGLSMVAIVETIPTNLATTLVPLTNLALQAIEEPSIFWLIAIFELVALSGLSLWIVTRQFGKDSTAIITIPQNKAT